MYSFSQALLSVSYVFKTTLGAIGNGKLNIIYNPYLRTLIINFKRLKNHMSPFEMENDSQILQFQKYCAGNSSSQTFIGD